MEEKEAKDTYSNLDEEYLEQARALRPLRKQQKNLEKRTYAMFKNTFGCSLDEFARNLEDKFKEMSIIK